MRKTTTTYLCDGCGEKAEKSSDLQRFQIVKTSFGGRSDVEVGIDLCANCEGNLLAAVSPFVPDDSKARLLDMGRQQAA